MTIVVASASPEGLVLAADSRVTEQAGAHRRVTSDSAHKVFEAPGGIGVATYGIALIGKRTIRGLFDEFLAGIEAAGDLAKFSDALGLFFQQKLDAATPARRGGGQPSIASPWPLGFLVAGYANGVGCLREVRVRVADFRVSDMELSTESPSAVVYRGQTGALRRLVRGVDFDEARAAQIRLPDDLEQRLETLHYELIAPITAQDAVDLAYFLIETTIGMQRFSDGTVAGRNRDPVGPVPGCGGPVQALAVEPRGIVWIARNDVRPSTGPGRSVGRD